MAWELQEAIRYYQTQGAPKDQNALTGLLREVHGEFGGIPSAMVQEIAREYGIKDSYILALIRRYPSLRLSDSHVLELCGGPNCPRKANLAAFVEKTYGEKPGNFTLKYVPCMRLCGKGPNLRWDGKLYHKVTVELLQELASSAGKP